jgi:hypothetical protein
VDRLLKPVETIGFDGLEKLPEAMARLDAASIAKSSVFPLEILGPLARSV